MKRLTPLLAAAGLFGSLSGGCVMAQTSSSQSFASSATNTYSGQIMGNGIAQYGLDTHALQQLTVTLSTNNPNSRMSVLKGDSSEVLCLNPAVPHSCTFHVEPDTSYRVRVFLAPEAVQRGESARFTLSLKPDN
ncbi:MAG: DNA breaking-rejoining protein [Comamonas sp.]|jgi:hypothetical protein|uniref:DNA breaking-rejoining protein n=1 Tax=Comamonas sp. TaxID=34028 RepID=UPI0028383A74|nr:DNA breaking-rejoining protein [Comamonas sp.]MDR0215885.1 DNA breaking-rejoining protein [Comamonas sp.]